MNTKLKKIITSYEAERRSLTTEMEECVAEMDYRRARLFFKALVRINQELQTLYSLQDVEYEEEDDLRNSIDFLEKKICENKEYNNLIFAEQLAKAKERLAELDQQSIPKQKASHVMRGVLIKVLSGEITGFTVVLQSSRHLSCSIRLVKRTLVLTIPEIRRHKKEYTLVGRQIREFKLLGFKLYDGKDKLMLFAPYSNLENVQVIQQILARITFEIFSFKELTGETLIKYHP